MGQEIETSEFSEEDFSEYRRLLVQETALLGELFAHGKFSRHHGVGGFELEAWLLDRKLDPAPINEQFLTKLNHPLVCAELALFNIEFNSLPHQLQNDALGIMRSELDEIMSKAVATAKGFDTSISMIGIPPTVKESDLVPANMSNLKRYRALNDQIMDIHNENRLNITIEGRDRLDIDSQSVMFESATTALQVQMQVDFRKSVRFYNAGLIAAAPLVAVSANSPYLFGKELWDETRIPLFEQSLAGFANSPDPLCRSNRVTLGQGYAKDSLFEIFEENLNRYQALLPMIFCDDPPEEFCHLRLHNGAIWRWVRPLVGFSEDGSHHLRIEHRVAPAGPTVTDVIANTAFCFGLVTALGMADEPMETGIPFKAVKDNFYRSAKNGLNSKIRWSDGKEIRVIDLCLNKLIPMAKEGLFMLGLDRSESAYYIDIIQERVKSGQNGACWQKAFVAKYGDDSRSLMSAYMKNAESGKPVNQWPIC